MNKAIAGKVIFWEYPACCLPSISNSFFTMSDLEFSNMFDSLDDSLDNPEDFQAGEMVASSPCPLTNKSKASQATKVKPKALKVMLVNCRSLKSDRKQHDLLDLVETHKPDIIFG